MCKHDQLKGYTWSTSICQIDKGTGLNLQHVQLCPPPVPLQPGCGGGGGGCDARAGGHSNKKSQLFGLAGTKVMLVHIVPRTLRCRSTPREYNCTPRHLYQSVRKKIVPRPGLAQQIKGGLLRGRTGHVSTAYGLIWLGGGDARPREHSTLFYPSPRQRENTNFKRL